MATIQEVDGEIARLCAQLIPLNKVRNTFSMVNRLPTELLVHIFKALPVDAHPTRVFMIKPPWTPLMGVCTYWRDLICQTPTLWRSVWVCNTDWAQLCLERSRTCTIDVTIPEREDGSRSDIDMAMLIPHLARVRVLEFFGLPSGGHQALNAFLSEKFQTLEFLQFSSRFAHQEDGAYFQLDVTSARFPKIRFLDLTCTAAPREASIYSNLRLLELRSCRFDSTSMDEFIQLLSHAVHLEGLQIRDAIPRSSPASRRSQQRAVTLPRLVSLHIKSVEVEETMDLLARLSLPRVDKFRIQPLVTDYTTLGADFFAAYPSLLPSDSVRSFPFVQHTTRVRLIVFGAVYYITCDDRDKETVPLEHFFELRLETEHEHFWDTSLPHALDHIIRIFRGAPLIESFVLLGDLDAVNVESWTALFEAFPKVKNLELGGVGEGLAKDMWTALRCASEGSGRVVCPALRHIKLLDDIDMQYGQPLLVTDDGVFTPEAMLNCLQYRADNGARLEYLGPFDMDSEPTDTNVAQLKALVDNLDITIRDPATE